MITTSNTLLLVIDVQGKLARVVYESEKRIKNISILIQGMKILGAPVLATEQYPQGLGGTIDEVSAHFEGVPLVTKDSFSCCGEPAFIERLQTYAHPNIVLCGIETHVCVYQTALDLLQFGYKVHVVTDGVSSRTEANWKLGVRKMEALGVELTGTEMFLSNCSRNPVPISSRRSRNSYAETKSR
jgi:nicotinamidase-related amidase